MVMKKTIWLLWVVLLVVLTVACGKDAGLKLGI